MRPTLLAGNMALKNVALRLMGSVWSGLQHRVHVVQHARFVSGTTSPMGATNTSGDKKPSKNLKCFLKVEFFFPAGVKFLCGNDGIMYHGAARFVTNARNRFFSPPWWNHLGAIWLTTAMHQIYDANCRRRRKNTALMRKYREWWRRGRRSTVA